jgi:Swi5-dependent recombination DNA repair protein 1
MHPTKRRRIDGSASSLSKPFKSPLRVEVKSKTRQDGYADQSSHLSTSAPGPVDNKVSETAATVSRLPPRPSFSSRPIRTLPSPSVSSPRAAAKDGQSVPLQKQHTALLRQVSTARQSLDTAQQALKICSSKQDAELEDLIAKWRRISREAAEELFRDARNRVNRMGGVRVWREKSRRRWPEWDTPDDGDLEELTEEQREQIEIQREEMRAEMEKYGGGKQQEDTVESGEEVFLPSNPGPWCSGLMMMLTSPLRWT